MWGCAASTGTFLALFQFQHLYPPPPLLHYEALPHPAWTPLLEDTLVGLSPWQKPLSHPWTWHCVRQPSSARAAFLTLLILPLFHSGTPWVHPLHPTLESLSHRSLTHSAQAPALPGHPPTHMSSWPLRGSGTLSQFHLVMWISPFSQALKPFSVPGVFLSASPNDFGLNCLRVGGERGRSLNI